MTRRHWRYLHDRTNGSIAGLHALIRRSAVRAVKLGTEAITREIMDSILLSYDHERAYARVVELRSRQSSKSRSKLDKKSSAAEGSA